MTGDRRCWPDQRRLTLRRAARGWLSVAAAEAWMRVWRRLARKTPATSISRRNVDVSVHVRAIAAGGLEMLSSQKANNNAWVSADGPLWLSSCDSFSLRVSLGRQRLDPLKSMSCTKQCSTFCMWISIKARDARCMVSVLQKGVAEQPKSLWRPTAGSRLNVSRWTASLIDVTLVVLRTAKISLTSRHLRQDCEKHSRRRE